MEVKRDILWRVYLSYILVIIACVVVFGKAVFIQQIQGSKWRSMSDSLHQRIDEIEAERGTIYSEDGQMLSTSIPKFDIYIDFRVSPLREKSGLLFREKIDSLCDSLAVLFHDQSATDYKRELQQGYKSSDPYFLLKKKISFREYEALRKFPLFNLGRYKSGLIVNEKTIRLNPYQNMALRTIGLARDANMVGLERAYDSLLRGRNGKQTVRNIAGGVGVPVDDSYLVEPETGKDIVSTLDVFIQEIAAEALMKMLVANDAEHGCAIVMETKTGKIKAMANLGNTAPGVYREILNYATLPSEPGSTFKLATMLALLEDRKVTLNQMINLENGVWMVAGRPVKDAEQHTQNMVTLKQAFELSSNVAMAKMANQYYVGNPQLFMKHLAKMQIDKTTGIDLYNESGPQIIKPGSKLYGPTTLPWMSFGYNIAISPLRTATLYNAIANNGVMMKPYLVNSVREEGLLLKEFKPEVLDSALCSNGTLRMLKACLEGVCKNGTAKGLFSDISFGVAGKTGTAKVAEGKKGYDQNIYQSSFAGYFPADNPQYTCVVVIKNKAMSKETYGAKVAGPVFREIAERMYSTYVKSPSVLSVRTKKVDSVPFQYMGYKSDISYLSQQMKISFRDSTGRADQWSMIRSNNATVVMNSPKISDDQMPALKGFGLKDAVYLCESMGLQVSIQGKGRVIQQSVLAGQPVVRGQLIQLTLN